ncbi:major facilitator superfamily domain-containing protein 6-like isoform X2 [Coccinella septempunctata]|uniref:major facilitator superfamily domain-containing protein 6-like isoform X2 n=1 Tax=Coccinella septempunctata TaxID=41139 RepID=UPI001D08BE4D|nr:major facilitator superfamily domain-containing protein 6-like isoform X2 [Coccinella septempunctata]
MVEKKLIPIKAHFFFFMAALGPILPQLQVFGKELGISSVVMGMVTGILPFIYLLAKPLFGIIVDVHRNCRKTIFMGLILIMAVCYGCIIFIPLRTYNIYNVNIEDVIYRCDNVVNTSSTDFIDVDCTSECLTKMEKYQLYLNTYTTSNASLCDTTDENQIGELPCTFRCKESIEIPNEVLLKTASFWFFIILLSVGTIAFNVVNSISDAVCFDVIGDQYDYGKQRIWGSIGYGLTALLSGYAMDNFLINMEGYGPAVCIMLIFATLDLFSCVKLDLPIIPAPENIWKELRHLMKYKVVCIFLIFTIIAGAADGFLTYFLLWYVEDISEQYDLKNVKVLEGSIIAAESLGGEILFFFIGDNILKKLGHVTCFSVCFLCYALRLAVISMVSSPWIIVGVEFFLQGPSYALTYLTIVAYANDIAPSGTSATMQGIAAGLDDGLGYALGSLTGGILYRYIGPRRTFQIFAASSALAGILHYLIHLCFLRKTASPRRYEAEYSCVSQTSNPL